MELLQAQVNYLNSLVAIVEAELIENKCSQDRRLILLAAKNGLNMQIVEIQDEMIRKLLK